MSLRRFSSYKDDDDPFHASDDFGCLLIIFAKSLDPSQERQNKADDIYEILWNVIA